MAKKQNTYGLNPKSHPLSLQWRIDQDYTKKLSREDKLWLADFIDGYYSGDFGGVESSKLSTQERRNSYTRKNVANSDAYHGLENEKLLSGFDAPVSARRFNNFTKLSKTNDIKVSDCIPDLPRDMSLTPEYLNSPEYKTALANFRSTLNPTRRVCKPKETPEYFAAQESLNKIIESNNHD